MSEFAIKPAWGVGVRRTCVLVGSVLVAALLAAPVQAAEGDLDPSFGSGGKVRTMIPVFATVQALAIQADGRIIAAGSASDGPDSTFALARYNPSGSLDPTFGSGGVVTTNFPLGAGGSMGQGVRAVALQPDGKIIAAGSSGFRNFAVARYLPNGRLDSTFGDSGRVTTDFGFDASALAISVDPVGKIRVAGVHTGFGTTTTSMALAQYTAGGTLDTAFGVGGKVISEFGPRNGVLIFAATFQPDGKILAVGSAFSNFAPFGSHGDFALARYNADGTTDTSFGTNGRLTTDFNRGTEDGARAVAIQPDGKLVAVGGTGAPPQFAVARYNSDGSLDSGFGLGGKVTTASTSSSGIGAHAVAIESSAHIVAAGHRFTLNERDNFALVRYTASGALDSSFGSNGTVTTDFAGGPDEVNALGLQVDGKIVAAGFGFDGPVGGFALARYLSAPPVVACTTTLTGSQSALVIRPGSGTVCLRDARVAGAVVVSGAGLSVESSVIGGAIVADEPVALRMCTSTARGSVTVSSATGAVSIGDPTNGACGGNTIAGAVTLLHNQAQVTVARNVIGGALVCSDNVPPPTNGGQANTVRARVGQCGGL